MISSRFPSLGQFVLLGICGLSLVFASLVRGFLPPRFLLDDGHVQRVISNPGVAPEDTSFHMLAGFYRALGLDASPALASLVSITVLIICVLLAIGFADWNRVGMLGAGGLVLTMCLGLAYLAQYTKEFVSLLIAFLVLLAVRSRHEIVRMTVIVGACLIYGALVRPYWLIIAALVPVIYFTLRRVRNPIVVVLAVIVAFIGLELAFLLFQGEHLGATREMVNSGREDASVATLIRNPDFGTTPIAGVLSILVVAFQLLVPITLFTMGSSYYLVAGVVIAMLWTLVAIAIFSGRARSERRTGWIAALLIALFIVLVIFEPDYGSYLKHLTPFLPLFLALLPHRRSERTPGRGVGHLTPEGTHVLATRSTHRSTPKRLLAAPKERNGDENPPCH